MPIKPPPGYSLEDVPDFLKPLVSTTKVSIEAPNSNYAGDVSIAEPRTIHIFGEDQATQPVLTHEMSHVWQDSRNLSVLADQMMDTFKGKIGKGYDYGGIDGLLEMQRQHKTIADLGPEAQADLVADYQKETKEAIDADDAARLDKANRAYGPFLQQFAALPARGESMTTMTQKDLTPSPPGLPPAMETGILQPNPLLGGQERILKNTLKLPKGYTLEK